jgi:hypothetical protein
VGIEWRADLAARDTSAPIALYQADSALLTPVHFEVHAIAANPPTVGWFAADPFTTRLFHS